MHWQSSEEAFSCFLLCTRKDPFQKKMHALPLNFVKNYIYFLWTKNAKSSLSYSHRRTYCQHVSKPLCTKQYKQVVLKPSLETGSQPLGCKGLAAGSWLEPPCSVPLICLASEWLPRPVITCRVKAGGQGSPGRGGTRSCSCARPQDKKNKNVALSPQQCFFSVGNSFVFICYVPATKQSASRAEPNRPIHLQKQSKRNPKQNKYCC